MQKAPEWIQAIAVLLGVVFAIYEFVLQDRATKLQERQAVIDLMKIKAEDIAPLSGKLADVLIRIQSTKHVTASEWHEAVSPFGEFYMVVSQCYNGYICDRKLLADVFCNEIRLYQRVYEDSSKKVGIAPTSLRSANEKFGQMWAACQ